MSRKIERLVNLTIALLATKRYLTKSEIFRSVEGYEGTAETKERMFERDKDDLRTLGISIEVGSFDPLFSDETGYRIRSDSYQLNMGEISPMELSLLSLAAQAWEGAALDESAQRALIKLSSLGISSELVDLPAIPTRLSDSSDDLKTIISAIEDSNFLTFSYISSDLTVSIRKIIPFSLLTRQGFWYFSGVDQDIQEIRTFRLDRIRNKIEIEINRDDFEFPFKTSSEFLDSEVFQQFATLDVRKGKGHVFRSAGLVAEDLGEWDRLKVPMYSIENMASQILWHGEDVVAQEPVQLRESVIESLRKLVKIHG